MKWPLLFLLAATGALADVSAQDDCHPEHTHLADKLLEWFSANEGDIKNAPCKAKSPPSMEKMNSFIQSKAKGSSMGYIHGISFKQESPALLTAFRELTTAKDEFGLFEMKENQKMIQAKYRINPQCEKVLCALEKIWGKELATKMLYIKLKHNYNTSELAFDNSSKFTKKELDDVLIALEDVPDHLAPLGGRNQRLTHYKRKATLPSYEGSTVYANAVVMLFDPWTAQSSTKRQYTLFHEFAHNIGAKFRGMDASPDWLKLSGWIKKGDYWDHNGKGCFLSGYGKENPWEDYAESVAAYRYNGQDFKKKCPKKYEFIKNNVFAIEYTDPKLCRDPASSTGTNLK